MSRGLISEGPVPIGHSALPLCFVHSCLGVVLVLDIAMVTYAHLTCSEADYFQQNRSTHIKELLSGQSISLDNVILFVEDPTEHTAWLVTGVVLCRRDSSHL